MEDVRIEDEKESTQPNAVVVFKLSDERMKVKKAAAKARRDFIRDRIREKPTG